MSICCDISWLIQKQIYQWTSASSSGFIDNDNNILQKTLSSL